MNEVVLSETTQAIVNVVFGVCLGFVFHLIRLASASLPSRSRSREMSKREMFRRLFDIDEINETAREGQEFGQREWGLMLALSGLVGVMIATVQLSPVSMRWWWFLGALLLVSAIMREKLRAGTAREPARNTERDRDDDSQKSRDD
ncbi:MAG: hypothetical protein AAGG07_14320 [Planctomycetota bacterium]